MEEVLVKSTLEVLQDSIVKENCRLTNPKNLGSDVYFATFSLTEDEYRILEDNRAEAMAILKSAEIGIFFLDEDKKEKYIALKISEQKTIGVSQISQTPRLMFFHNPADLTEKITRVVFRQV